MYALKFKASNTIQLLNDWFDLFNSNHKYDNSRLCFGLDIENQTKLINEMNKFISEMKIHGKKNSSLPFQKYKTTFKKIIFFYHNYYTSRYFNFK